MANKKNQYKIINNYIEVFNKKFLKKKYKIVNKFDFNRALYRSTLIKDYIFFKKNVNKKFKIINYESSIVLPDMLIDHQSYFAKYYILINYILEKTFFLPFLHHNRVKIIKI